MSVTAVHPRVEIEQISNYGKVQYRGRVVAKDGTVLHEVVRWSENGTRSAVTSYLLTARDAAVVPTAVQVVDSEGVQTSYVAIEEGATNIFEGTRVPARTVKEA